MGSAVRARDPHPHQCREAAGLRQGGICASWVCFPRSSGAEQQSLPLQRPRSGAACHAVPCSAPGSGPSAASGDDRRRPVSVSAGWTPGLPVPHGAAPRQPLRPGPRWLVPATARRLAPPMSLSVTAGCSEEMVPFVPSRPGSPQGERPAGWFSYVCFLISLILLHYTQPVTMTNTAMEMLKKILYMFHVFEKNPTFLNKLMHKTDGRKKRTQNKPQHN